MQAMTKGGVLTVQPIPEMMGFGSAWQIQAAAFPRNTESDLRAFLHNQEERIRAGFDDRATNSPGTSGRLELESHVGHGTTFRLWLPLRQRQPRLLELLLMTNKPLCSLWMTKSPPARGCGQRWRITTMLCGRGRRDRAGPLGAGELLGFAH